MGGRGRSWSCPPSPAPPTRCSPRPSVGARLGRQASIAGRLAPPEAGEALYGELSAARRDIARLLDRVARERDRRPALRDEVASYGKPLSVGRDLVPQRWSPIPLARDAVEQPGDVAARRRELPIQCFPRFRRRESPGNARLPPQPGPDARPRRATRRWRRRWRTRPRPAAAPHVRGLRW